MARERGDHTLQATALVNETFLRLVQGNTITVRDRLHFHSLCSRVMRQILVDHARGRLAAKRGGPTRAAAIDDVAMIASEPRQDFVALDEALRVLADVDERKSRVVELRFFGGLTVEETAMVIEVSAETVMRDWQFAKSWLQRYMRGDSSR